MVSCDVVILGAGPAGSTLAYLLAKAGLSVLVLDRDEGPVFKVGESLLPEGIRLCHEMGLADVLADGPFIEKHGALFVLSEDGAQRRFAFADAIRAERGALAYEVKRKDFDAMLQTHAESAGAEIRWGYSVRDVDFEAHDALTSVLAGDIFDVDNPLIRMGVFGG